jgi:lipopolysaccharide transport protein LptA
MSVENSSADPAPDRPKRIMTIANPRIPTRLRTVVATLLVSPLVFAQLDELRLPMQLDADSTDYDGKNSMLMFRGLRLTQGTLGIAADEGRASKMDFEDSIWHFTGNVVIDVDNGHIESDSAEMEFSGYELSTATIIGSPATFRMKRPDNGQEIYAEAGKLQYDFSAGVIEFSDQATIMEGGNQISSNFLVYNIAEQRINASSGGEGNAKVRITYTPDSPGVLNTGDDSDLPGTGEESGGPGADIPEESGESG